MEAHTQAKIQLTTILVGVEIYSGPKGQAKGCGDTSKGDADYNLEQGSSEG